MALLTAATSKKSLHPSRRMAWEILRHGVAVFSPSGCRSQTPYHTKRYEYKKILQISENNSVFILYIQNKAISLQCCSGQHNNNQQLTAKSQSKKRDQTQVHKLHKRTGQNSKYVLLFFCRKKHSQTKTAPLRQNFLPIEGEIKRGSDYVNQNQSNREKRGL